MPIIVADMRKHEMRAGSRPMSDGKYLHIDDPTLEMKSASRADIRCLTAEKSII